MTWLFPQQYANLRLMHQFAEQFGLTPAARSRIIAGNDNNGSADDMDAILGGD
jgi:Phage terminase, small subunit.